MTSTSPAWNTQSGRNTTSARRGAANQLFQTHVDSLRGEVLVIGDWNAKLLPRPASPFKSEPATWLTQPLEAQGLSSSVFGSFIDHALVTPPLLTRHIRTSVFDLRPNYRNNTSDHFPVLRLVTM